jgi:hypothetical protein
MTQGYLDSLEVILQEPGLLQRAAQRGRLHVVFTGSRDLPSEMRPPIAIMFELVNLHFGRDVRLAHGGARGADEFADVMGRRYRWQIEPYPVPRADWDRYGGWAGQRRNGLMLTQEGPDVVLGVQWRNSSGTGGCARDALSRGIHTVLVTEELAQLPRARATL